MHTCHIQSWRVHSIFFAFVAVFLWLSVVCVIAADGTWNVAIKPCLTCLGLGTLTEALKHATEPHGIKENSRNDGWNDIPAIKVNVHAHLGRYVLGPPAPVVVLIGTDNNGCGNVDDGAFVHLARANAFEEDPSDKDENPKATKIVVIAVRDGTHSPLVCSQGAPQVSVDGNVYCSSGNCSSTEAALRVMQLALSLQRRKTVSEFKIGTGRSYVSLQKRRPRVGIIHYRPKTTSLDSFEVGFRAAVELLQADLFTFTWINLDDFEGKTLESIDLNSLAQDFDVLWVKSNWDWTVDTFCRAHLRSVRETTPMVLFISGVGTPPVIDEEVLFYDLLFYETDWYRPQLEGRHPLLHKAMGIDTRVMRPMSGFRKSIECLFIGWMAFYKRPERFARHIIGTSTGEYSFLCASPRLLLNSSEHVAIWRLNILTHF